MKILLHSFCQFSNHKSSFFTSLVAAVWSGLRVRVLNGFLNHLLWSVINKSPPCADNHASPLDGLSGLKRHLLEENEHCLLARICSTHLWEGSKSQYVHQFFPPWFFMPQMIHYIAADQEPGVDWSPMPLHMHTSTAQLPPLPRHRIQEICTWRAELSPWCQRWLNPET